MKLKAFFILIFIYSSLGSIWAQSSELTPSIGYQFGTKYNYGPTISRLKIVNNLVLR